MQAIKVVKKQTSEPVLAIWIGTEWYLIRTCEYFSQKAVV